MEKKKKALKNALLLFVLYWVVFNLYKLLLDPYMHEKTLFTGWQRILATSWITPLILLVTLEWKTVKSLFKKEASE
jgi:hypothetical protein